jgi:hypothetical protein
MNAQASRLAAAYSTGGSSTSLFAPLTKSALLNPETFGALIVFAWAARNGRSDLPDRDTLAAEFLEHRHELPPEGLDVLHPETRSIGNEAIAEYSEYMAAAQDAGLIRRYNPAYVRCHVEVGQIEALDRLAEYRRTHGDLIKWLENRVEKLSQR